MIVRLAPIELHCQSTYVKGVLLLCDWRKKKRICVVMLAFAAIQPTLCATAHHMLCLLLVVVAADWAASLLTSHVLLVVFSSGQEMFQIVVALLVEAGTPLLQCLSVMFLFFFLIYMQQLSFCNMGAVKLVALPSIRGCALMV